MRKTASNRPMKRTKSIWVLVLLFCEGLLNSGNWAAAQANNCLPDSPSEVSTQWKHRNDPGSDRVVTWRSLPKDFLRDQKGIWLFPLQLGKGRYWMPTLAISGITAGLIVADPHA